MKNEDILLINLPLVDYKEKSTSYIKIIPPIGLGYLATIAGKHNIKCRIIDAEYEKLSHDQLLNKISEINPSIVGISIPSPLLKRAKILINSIKKSSPNCTIIVGGIHPSIIMEKILTEIPSIDIAFVGESENSFEKFILGTDKNEIKGILFWDNDNNIVSTGLPDQIAINDLPILDRKYFANDPWKSSEIIESYICSSRGCPYKCTYCSAGIIQGKKIRSRSVKNIMQEIDYLVKSFNTNYLHFVDDNFIMSKKKAYSFCNCIHEANLKLKWRFLARVNVMSKFSQQDYYMLYSAGCDLMSIGIESGSPEVLKKIKKEIDLENIQTIVERAHNAKIRVKGFFIMGFPFEKMEDIELTRKFIINSDLDDVNISFLRVFPGTELYDQLIKQGFDEKQLTDYMQFAEIFNDEATKNERIKKAELYLLAHYMSLNPNISIERILEEIKNTYDLFFNNRN